MKYCQIVMGTAGTGKSTYCKTIQDHCSAAGRTVRIGNLDPAAEVFDYQASFDIRTLISVDSIMEEMQLGPNGALVFAMEYLVNDMKWLVNQLDTFVEDDYLILDCPGQIELYTHIPLMRRVVDVLRAKDFNVCAIYCLDSLFITDASKLISGNLTALSGMIHLELPHINVLTKCDLANPETLEKYLSPSGRTLVSELNRHTPPRFRRLNEELTRLLDAYDMVSFVPLNINDEDSIENLLLQVDHCIQYGEDMEPKEPKEYDDADNDGGRGGFGYDAIENNSFMTEIPHDQF